MADNYIQSMMLEIEKIFAKSEITVLNLNFRYIIFPIMKVFNSNTNHSHFSDKALILFLT